MEPNHLYPYNIINTRSTTNAREGRSSVLQPRRPVNLSYLELYVPPIVNRNTCPDNDIVGGALVERITPDAFPLVCSFLQFKERCLSVLHLSHAIRGLLNPSCWESAEQIIHFTHSRARTDADILSSIMNRSAYLSHTRSITIKNEAYDMFYSLPLHERTELVNRVTSAVRGPNLRYLELTTGYRSFVPELPRLELIVGVMNALLERNAPSHLHTLVVKFDAPITMSAFREIDWSGLATCQSLAHVSLDFPRLDEDGMQESIDRLLDSLPSSVQHLELMTDTSSSVRGRRVVNLDRYFRTQQIPHLVSLKSNSQHTALDALGTRMEITHSVRPIRELRLTVEDIQPRLFISLAALRALTLIMAQVYLDPSQIPRLSSEKAPSLIKLEMIFEDQYKSNIYEPLLRYFFKSPLQDINIVFGRMTPWSNAFVKDLGKVRSLRSLLIDQVASSLGTMVFASDVLDESILPVNSWPYLVDMAFQGLSCTMTQVESLVSASPRLKMLIVGCTAAVIPAIAVRCPNIERIRLISEHQWPVSEEDLVSAIRTYPWHADSFRHLQSLRFAQYFAPGVDRLFFAYFGGSLPSAVSGFVRWRIESGTPLVNERVSSQ